jgi:hypothetical protein
MKKIVAVKYNDIPLESFFDPIIATTAFAGQCRSDMCL